MAHIKLNPELPGIIGPMDYSPSTGIPMRQLAEAGWARGVWKDQTFQSLNSKMKALLNIAGKVQKNARDVSADDIAAAKATGVTDREIHDTVLIAAAFCMYNRYVDGLATMQPPREHPAYAEMGSMLATQGYLR